MLKAAPYSTPTVDPGDLEGLRRQLRAADPQSRLLPLEIKRIQISSDAHLGVARAVAEAWQGSGRANIVLLTDNSSIMRGPDRLSELVKGQLVDADLRHVTLDDGHATLHAGENILDAASAAANGTGLIITIGSGTMTDIGKVAAHRNGNLPHIALQTAVSVDGFTDNVSVVLKNGVKRTIPSAWPTIVLADTVTIGGAPRELNTSGFGEAISLFTAPADWYLANLAGLDRTFHPASMDLLQTAAAEPPSWSAGIAQGETAAIEKLTRLLAVRGIVSGVSATTACLSGVEHVISHMLDLHHAAKHQPIGLHGAQVGVATLIAAKLWRRAIDTDLIASGSLKKPDVPDHKVRVEKAFASLGQNVAAECWHDCQRKLALIESNWTSISELVANWKQLSTEFGSMVQLPDTLRPALVASGAPATFGDLNPSISPQLARWAMANCHLMRNRFNLVDLLDLLGLWNDELIDWLCA